MGGGVRGFYFSLWSVVSQTTNCLLGLIVGVVSLSWLGYLFRRV